MTGILLLVAAGAMAFTLGVLLAVWRRYIDLLEELSAEKRAFFDERQARQVLKLRADTYKDQRDRLAEVTFAHPSEQDCLRFAEAVHQDIEAL